MYNRWTCLVVISLVMSAAAAAPAQTSKPKVPKANTAATDTKATETKRSAPPRSPSEEVPPPSTAAANIESPEPAATKPAPVDKNYSRLLLVSGISIFVLSVFVGFEVISKVPATLHTPLMSGSNAISGITVVGAIIAAASGWGVSSFLGFFAVVLAMVNVVGGFLVTHRMLLMFKRK